VLGTTDMGAIAYNKQLTSHLNWDAGSIFDATSQQLVASGKERSFDPAAHGSAEPAFLYITGDRVYFNGQISEFYA
jgi:hypothetical protein